MPKKSKDLPEEFAKQNGDFRKVVEEVARKKSAPFEVFVDFCTMAACCFAAQTREEEYLQVAGKYEKEELNRMATALGMLVMEMERKPFQDLLGPYYLEVGSKFSRDLRGEFYTPRSVGDAITKMMFDIPKIVAEGKPISVNDPACGSSGLILSVAELFAKGGAVDLIRATCQDVSRVACDMSYVNLTLWGVPARVILGNTLAATTEHVWTNIHWHRVGEPMREQLNEIEKLFRSPAEKEVTLEGQESPETPSPKEASGGQQEWTFE